jgi:hypothetical protein
MSSESTDSKPSVTGDNAPPPMMRHEAGSLGENKGTIAQGGSATIHDRTALYISIFAMVLSALCLGLFLMQTFLMPQIIDAKIQAGSAKAEAVANEARTNARVALDKVEDIRPKLAEQGIKIKPLDGH